MSGAAAIEGEDRIVVTVCLTCISCGAVEEIHVFEERKLPGKMYWECFSCQADDRGSRTGPGVGVRH